MPETAAASACPKPQRAYASMVMTCQSPSSRQRALISPSELFSRGFASMYSPWCPRKKIVSPDLILPPSCLMIVIFLRGHQGEYIDANPLEKASDGEIKARWRDEGDWQVM